MKLWGREWHVFNKGWMFVVEGGGPDPTIIFCYGVGRGTGSTEEAAIFSACTQAKINCISKLYCRGGLTKKGINEGECQTSVGSRGSNSWLAAAVVQISAECVEP